MSLPAGVMPASVTPMDPQGRIDEPSLVRLLAWFADQDCAGVVIAGTNGEGPSLSAVEKRDLVTLAVRHSMGLPIVAGIATSSLEEAKWLVKQAGKSGAAGVLLMPPSYWPEASPTALIRWFREVMDASAIPVLAYNFPKRVGFELSTELLMGIADHPRCGGAKDSSGNVANLAGYRAALPRHQLYVGAEQLLMQALEHGWTGSISGAANCIPSWLAAVVRDYHAGHHESAATKFDLILPDILKLKSIPQPASNKAFLKAQGIIEHASLRLPLEPVDAPPALSR
jgi:4-hydroxy-tetrahydrodipicolinate synthase